MKFRVFWDVLLCSQVGVDTFQRCILPPSSGRLIALMMEAVHTSETLVNIYLTTQQYIPEDSELPISYVSQLYFSFVEHSSERFG
jgi:hypothetical protein